MRDRALKKEHAAEILGHSATTLADPRWRLRVGLRATRVGKSLRFLESEVRRVLQSGLEEFGSDRQSLTKD